MDELRPHPRNYRAHPGEQRAHLVASIEEHGVYRNVIATVDGTLLAGHGVVEAAVAAGVVELPVVVLDVDPESPAALRVLAGDNEVGRLAVGDERVLAELLGELRELDGLDGLAGTGYDDDSLETLFRLAAARGGTDVSAEWEGMPGFEQPDRTSAFHTTVHFGSEADAEAFFELVGVTRRASFWWPESDGLVGSDVGAAWVAAGEAGE